MHLTEEQRQAILDRNNSIRDDFTKGLLTTTLMSKYKLSRETINKVVAVLREKKKEPVGDLTEFQKRLIQKYRSFDIVNEYGKALPIRAWDVEITVQPKRPY